jgi:hypothetical protein
MSHSTAEKREHYSGRMVVGALELLPFTRLCEDSETIPLETGAPAFVPE